MLQEIGEEEGGAVNIDKLVEKYDQLKEVRDLPYNPKYTVDWELVSC